MSVCVYVCVLAVWRLQIRWQLSYRAEPTYPKPSQTSGVTARWLFPKHPLIFMSISHHFAVSHTLPDLPSVSIPRFAPTRLFIGSWAHFSPVLLLCSPFICPVFSVLFFWSFLVSIHLALQSISAIFGQLWQCLLSCLFPPCPYLTLFFSFPLPFLLFPYLIVAFIVSLTSLSVLHSAD